MENAKIGMLFCISLCHFIGSIRRAIINKNDLYLRCILTKDRIKTAGK